MGAYENPAIIRDTSGQIYGQAIASFGQSIAKGISIYGQKAQEANKKAQEKIERQQRIAYDIEDKAYAQANKNYAELASKDPSLVDQFKSQTELLLRGNGENIGAIKAQTLLATKNDLTKEERQNYRNIVNRAQTFQISAVEGGGKILADLEDQQGILAQDIASTHAWVGSNELEKDTSMLTSYVLGGKKANGLTGNKELVPGENGSMIVKVTSTVDENSDLFKNLDEETKEFLKNNDYKLEWKKNINEWNEGLIDEIPEKADYNQMSITNGFESKEGSITPEYIVGGETGVSKIISNGKIFDAKYIDVDSFINSQSFQKDVLGKASGYLARGNGQLSSFMTYKMRDGSFNVNEFKKQTTPQQEQEVVNALIEDFKNTKLSDLEQRKATPQDVKNLRALGKNVKVGQSIYVETVGSGKDIPSSSYVQTLGDQIVNDVINLKITPIETVGGLQGDVASVKTNADRVRNANIETHKKYLRSKGINAKSKADLISQLEKLKGTKDGDGNKIDDDYIENFRKASQNMYVYDAENKKQYELPSYNPDSNESLLPILNEYGGFGSKTKERISTTILP
ncbi:MAG: hypothetical protein CMJ25_17285 [Phycisphaerae bacterium]|nr:hypothetical protein [Phycisphaerae bacterium]|tara:strand:+ start:1258 stop:2970 length:1713 start_codon:yes stop_codon:yes gene_type:complete